MTTLAEEVNFAVQYATCYERGCRNRATTLKPISDSLTVAVCKLHA